MEIYQNTTERISNFTLKDLENEIFFCSEDDQVSCSLLIFSYDVSSLEPNTFLELLNVSIGLKLHLII